MTTKTIASNYILYDTLSKVLAGNDLAPSDTMPTLRALFGAADLRVLGGIRSEGVRVTQMCCVFDDVVEVRIEAINPFELYAFSRELAIASARSCR